MVSASLSWMRWRLSSVAACLCFCNKVCLTNKSWKKKGFHVFFRISYDPTRYPRSIPEAYCLCKGCLIGPSGEESRQYRSTPVYSPSVILRRTGSCAGGRHSYSEIYVSIAVGCTCVPLLEKDRELQSRNQTLQRGAPKARRVSAAGNKG